MTPHSFRRFWLVCCAVAFAIFATGCATNRTYEVKVDAITRPAASDPQSYTLKSKNPAVGEENLRYREAAELVKTALSGKGLYEAPTAEKADMVVELDYGMEAPRTKVERVSVPVYAQVGGGVRYDTVPVTDARGNTTYRTVAVYDPPRTELIGYDDVPRQITVYEKYLRITARENKEVVEGRPPAELWSVHASAEDESKDLRKYLPMMASASADYIGRNSSSQKVVKVRENEPGVDFIRQGISNPAVAGSDASPKT